MIPFLLARAFVLLCLFLLALLLVVPWPRAAARQAAQIALAVAFGVVLVLHLAVRGWT